MYSYKAPEALCWPSGGSLLPDLTNFRVDVMLGGKHATTERVRGRSCLISTNSTTRSDSSPIPLHLKGVPARGIPFGKATKATAAKRTPASKRRMFRVGLIAGNVLLLAAVLGVVFIAPEHASSDHPAQVNAVFSAPDTEVANPLDQLASANIALTAARMTGLAETTAITNQADSQSAEMSIMTASNMVAAKPQVVTTTFKSNKDIVDYVVKKGDTVSKLAARFDTTSDSIRWSNGLTGNSLKTGTKLVIPPVPGIVHTVKKGETAAGLATKYNADKYEIIAFNFAEVDGLKPGERIVIPGGNKAAAVVQQATSTYSFGWGGTPAYGSYNGYDYGYCTWWVAKLRAGSGNPLPSNLGNASTWAYRAQAYGIPVGSTPRVGAAVVTSTAGAGHVAYVTAVNADGTITISEMNHLGWNITDTRTIAASPSYRYVY